MRILIVDVNFEYKNPMYRQFYNAFAAHMDVGFFGPGFVSREQLEKGIGAYLDACGRYDAILLGTYFVYSAGLKRARHGAYHVHRHTLPYYKVNDAYQCCGKILEELKGVTDTIKIFAYYEDLWSMPAGDKEICEKLLASGFYILSWPIEYMERCRAGQGRRDRGQTGHAYEIARRYSERYIPIPLHAIGYHEIFVRNFQDREYDWCIPGNRVEKYYPEREKAHAMVRKRQKRVWDDDPYQQLSVETIRRRHMRWYKFRNDREKFLSWIWGKDDSIASQPKMQYIGACREQYMESMRSAKMVYAESGIISSFVRKYFEACACGAVLVGKRVPGMAEMGFVNGVNCIILEGYEEMLDIDRTYAQDRLEKIAGAGQRLVLEKHMYRHRIEALERTLTAISGNVYRGAYWEKGEHKIRA